MKTIGIITLSSSDNCGSLLQCYALQTLLEQIGCYVEIINFENHKSKKMYRIFHPGYIVYPLKFIGQFTNYRKIKKQKMYYKKFRKKYLHLSQKKYTNIAELQSLDGKYYAVICGSDQIWNTNMFDFDPAYLLGWCRQSKKYSYAASLGDHKDINNLRRLENYLPLLNQFNEISIREAFSLSDTIRGLKIRPTICLDPTLLLSKKAWEKLIKPRININKPFIFYYSYNYNDDKINNIVAAFSSLKGLPVYIINPSRWVDNKVSAL